MSNQVQHKISGSEKTNNNNQNRWLRLAPLAQGEHQLQLQIQDTIYESYGLDLGICASISLAADMSSQDNLLIPLQLKRYNYAYLQGAPAPTEEQEKVLSDKELPFYSDDLRVGGYVYVFVDDYLWRELKVVGREQYQDVNLSRFRGFNERPATGQLLSYVNVPQMIGGKRKKIELTYSEVQWSWAYLNAFGGLATNDSRLLFKAEPGGDDNAQLPDDVPQPDKSKRLQDISEALANWASIVERPEPSSQDKPQNKDIVVRQRADQGLTCYLHDPLGCAQGLAEDVATVHLDMLTIKAKADSKPQEYKMAQLVQQIVIAKPDYKKYVDMTAVKQDLYWDQYTEILTRLNACLGYLGEFLTANDYQASVDGMSVATAMIDYWVQVDDRYLLGLGRLSVLLNDLCLFDGYDYLFELAMQKNSALSPVFHPNKQQRLLLTDTNFVALVSVLNRLVGVSAKEVKVRTKIYTLLHTLVDQYGDGKFSLRKTTVDLDTVMEQAADKNSAKPLAWGQVFVDKTQPEHVKAETQETYVTPLGKKAQWLQQYSPLIRKGMGSFFLLVETINMVYAIQAWHDSDASK